MKSLICMLSVAMIFSQIPMADAETNTNILLLEELHVHFPNARFAEVTQKEFDILVAMSDAHAAVLVEPPSEQTRPSKAPKKTNTFEHRPPPPRGAIVPARARVGPRTQVAVYGEGTGSIATDDLAIILYVLVGAVVIAAAVIYGGFILYEMITGTTDYRYWGSCGAGVWHFMGSGRKGGMYGGRMSLGLVGKQNRVGLLLEAGYLDGRFRFRDEDGFLTVSGTYGLLGPTVQWALGKGPNPMALDVELLTGYSTADRVGLMSRAMAGLSWGLGSRWRFGLQAGSTYAKIRESEGPLNTESDFNLTLGGWLGANF